MVNGCFWHAHEGCLYFKVPATRPEFWRNKLTTNRERDLRNVALLEQAGWRVAVVWECATRKDLASTVDQLEGWLRGTSQRVDVAWKQEHG